MDVEGTVNSDLSLLDIVGHVVIWVVLSAITLGAGLLFWPYAAGKLIINSISFRDSTKSRRLRCDLTITQQVGHVVIWGILIVCTAGILAPFYLFGVAKTLIDATVID